MTQRWLAECEACGGDGEPVWSEHREVMEPERRALAPDCADTASATVLECCECGVIRTVDY